MELAKMPKELDRALFVSGLGSPDNNFQAICARALNELDRLPNSTNCWLFRDNRFNLSYLLFLRISGKTLIGEYGLVKK